MPDQAQPWVDPYAFQPLRPWWLRWLPALPPVYSCEVCKATGVRRGGDWDHCPVGHRYVGLRAEHRH